MKTFLTTLALSLATTLSVADTTADWSVETIDKDTADTYVYTILPETVSVVEPSDGEPREVHVVVEIYIKSNARDIARRRIRVNGCQYGTGKVALAQMDGSISKEVEILEWDKDGGRVYDILAVGACTAHIVKYGSFRNLERNKQTPPSTTPKPPKFEL